jgi:hypothetical protein
LAVCPGATVAVAEPDGATATAKSCPVPVSVTVCGLLAALSVTANVPLLAPIAVGSKETPIVQLEPATSLLPQGVDVLTMPKSAGLTATFVIASVAVPVFVSVTVCVGPEFFTYWAGKATLSGDKVAVEAVPVPARPTVWGLPGASSAMLTAALRLPTVVGVNVTLTWQEWFGARVRPQLFFCAKSLASVPVRTMFESVNVAAPVFVSVVICGELVVKSVCGPKVKLAGIRETAGAVPVPARPTVWGLPGASSAMLTAALRLPVAMGVKVTLTWQEW